MIALVRTPRAVFTGLVLALLAIFAPNALAQPTGKPKPPATADRIDFEVNVDPKEAKPGETVHLIITGKPKKGSYTYPLTKTADNPNTGQPATLTFKPAPGLQPLWPVTETPGEWEYIKDIGNVIKHKHDFNWAIDVLILPDAKPGPIVLPFDVFVQVCNRTCVDGVHPLEATILVKDGTPVELTPKLQERRSVTQPPIEVVSPPGGGPTPAAAPSEPKKDGLLAFVLQGVFWGFVSLITPCVFPMIPITVSFFLKQSEKEHHRPIAMAFVYCATIIIVLTIAAVALLSFFQALSQHYATNFGIGALFVFFALSLFGMYDIELPTGLARFTSSREGQGGFVGTIFMALTFTIISFACVAPFLGGFGGTTDTSQLSMAKSVLGGAAFATTFASPFFVLALFPNLLKKMPRSGSWLNSVKVVMGFLELAAAFKFLRAGELVLLPEPVLFTYDLAMASYVAIAFLCGLYLLNVYMLPHDTPIENLGVPRLLMGVIFIGFGFYLTPALFKTAAGANQRPAGVVFSWVDSFLLPDVGSELPRGENAQASLVWGGNLQAGLAEARAKKQLVFVDFTGKTCANCRLNEHNVFPRREIHELLQKYVLVQLYTDSVPLSLYTAEQRGAIGNDSERLRADAAENKKLQSEKFGNLQLPLYVILQPQADGSWKELSRYEEGKINDVAAFTRFLQEPLKTLPASASVGGEKGK